MISILNGRTVTAHLTGKRFFDVLVGGCAAVVTLPLQGALLAASAISFRAWPIFSQPRVGLNGETFTFRKIRSLPTSAPAEADKYEIGKVKNSRFGRFVRGTHLDELLQLWSVAGGDMSLIGPRPEMLGLSASYDEAFVAERTKVRPGVTGLWQVSDGVRGLIGETPQYDEFYVRAPSWKVELFVLVSTVRKMVSGSTVADEQIPDWHDGWVADPIDLIATVLYLDAVEESVTMAMTSADDLVDARAVGD